MTVALDSTPAPITPSIGIVFRDYDTGIGHVTTTKHADSRTTREKILDVATDLIVEQGYPGTPLSLIAKKLDLTKAALYYHFRSKEDILTGIVSPLLDEIDILLAGAPEQFSDANQRWDFIVDYAQILLSCSRGVAVLAISDSKTWMPPTIKDRIERHRKRVTELAMLPGMSQEQQVQAVLIMDMLQREIVFSEDRIAIPGMSPEHRREIVYRFAQQALDL